MNNSSAAIDWIVNHADRLNLSVEAFDWNLPFDSKIFDCSVRININEIDGEGRGSAETEELALLKAFSEAVDRVAFAGLKSVKTTNGIAVHLSEEAALHAARCELIERDSFFCHYLTHKAFFSTKMNLSELGFESQLFDFLKGIGIEYQLAEMHSINGYFSYIFMTHGLNATPKMGLMFGMGCNTNAHNAARSAVLEGLRHVIASINAKGVAPINQETFASKVQWGPEDHLALCGDLNYAEKQVQFFFETVEKTIINIPQAQEINISCDVLQLDPIFSNSPFVAVRARSARLQDIFFGPTLCEKVNFLRLQEFLGGECSWEMINKLPHPLA